MKLNVQKRIAASILKCSPKRVKLDAKRVSEIKEAITRADLKRLIEQGAIVKENKQGISRFHAKKRKKQKGKGRQRGKGKRRGTKNARTPGKRAWINKVRLQRSFIKQLKEKGAMDITVARDIYLKIKGGFFRSLRHLKLYLEDNKLTKKVNSNESH